MKSFVKLAWRNLWRNKRRTLITTASVFFGVVLSAFMSSMQEGSYAQYIAAIVNSYSGHLQIHQKGYWADKVINNSFDFNQDIDKNLKTIGAITVYTPRFENFCLASSGEVTKGVMVMGIDPEKEDKITNISGKIRQGKFLCRGDKGVVLAGRLARFLRLEVNDTLVLIGQGYHGVSAAGKFPVRGIIRHPSPELDRTLVCMELGSCQELFSAPGRLTSLAIMVKENELVEPAGIQLRKSLGNNLEVMDWEEMNQLLLKQIESDRAQGVITKGILYIIIAFGIIGTVIMMIAERRKEFGVMLAIGMHRSRLMFVVVLETVFIGMTGVVSGIAASIPILWYYLYNPIPLTGQAEEMLLQMGFEPAMFFSMAPSIFYEQALTIFIFTLIIGIYPALAIQRLNVMHALRS